MAIKRYEVRVFIPIAYEIYAENEKQAARKAVEYFKKDIQTERAALIANLTDFRKDPEVQVFEMPDW